MQFKIGEKVKLLTKIDRYGLPKVKFVDKPLDEKWPFRIEATIEGVEELGLTEPLYTVWAHKQIIAVLNYNLDPGRRVKVYASGIEPMQKPILRCKNCNTTNEYAVPNQTDGTYICYEHPR